MSLGIIVKRAQYLVDAKLFVPALDVFDYDQLFLKQFWRYQGQVKVIFALAVAPQMRLARAPLARQRDHFIVNITEQLPQLRFGAFNRHEFTSA